jgi:FecR protein
MGSSRSLIRGFIDDRLDSLQRDELESLLRSPDMAREFLREIHFDHAIRIAAASAERRAAWESGPTLLTTPASPAPSTGRYRSRRLLRWVMPTTVWPAHWVAALLMLLAIPATIQLYQAWPSAPIAHLAVHLGQVSINDESRVGTSDLANGAHIRVSSTGRASLRLRDGSLIELAGGSEVRVQEHSQGVTFDLDSGELRGEISRQPVGKHVCLVGRQAQATVLGTRLSFSTSATGDQLTVISGLVACRNRANGEEVQVASNQQVIIYGAQPLNVMPLRAAKATLPLLPSAGLVYWFDASEGVITDTQGRVKQWNDCRGHGGVLISPLNDERPMWHELPQPYVHFTERREHMTGTLPFPSSGSFTFACVLRAQTLGRWSQNFSWGWGCFVFHATPEGSIFTGTGSSNDDRMRFIPGTSDEDIPPNTMRVNTWHRFIVAYGNGMGSFYKDGRLIARKAMPPATPKSLFLLSQDRPSATEPFGFAGDLRTWLLYDRLLQPQELDLINQQFIGVEQP